MCNSLAQPVTNSVYDVLCAQGVQGQLPLHEMQIQYWQHHHLQQQQQQQNLQQQQQQQQHLLGSLGQMAGHEFSEPEPEGR